jgi:hypothetical protein
MICKKCKIDKSLKDFPKNKNCKNSIEKTCRCCRNEKHKENPNFKNIRVKANLKWKETKGKNYQSKYYEINNDKLKLDNKEYYHSNKEIIRKYKKDYDSKNRDKINITLKNYYKKYPWRKIWRSTMNNVLNRLKIIKSDKTINLLGYTYQDLKNHLESKFTDEMNWNNYGTYWVVDHIKPVSKFESNTNIKEIHSLNNLQPLEKLTNLKKAAKYE